MTVNYNNKAASAKRMLNKFGSFGYVKLRVVTSTGDPVNGETTTNTDFDLTAVDLKVTKDMITDGLIKSTDRMVIASSDIKPETDNKIVINSIPHKIINIENISPTGVDVIYKIVCRA